MAQKPITMEQLKQILQLKNDGIGIREIARRAGMSRNCVRKYLSQLHDGSDPLSDKNLLIKLITMNNFKPIQKESFNFWHTSNMQKQNWQKPVLRACCCGMNIF
jgi:biotin operon repressor